jgi:hypothetical protein
MAVFYVVAPCSLVKVYGNFRGVFCLQHQGDEQARGLLIALTTEDSHLHTRRLENLKS